MKAVEWAAVGLMVAFLGLPVLRAQSSDPSDADELWDYVIPEGTEFKLQLHTTVHTKKSKEGDRVIATLVDPVVVEDADVLPRGLRIDGHVDEVVPAQRKGRKGWLTIVFDTVELPSGEKVTILGSLTEVFATEGKHFPDVGLEGEIKGKGASIWLRLPILVVPPAGAVASGLHPAAAVGVGVATLITAIVLPKGRNISLAAGSVVGMRLDRDLTISLAVSPDYE